MNDEVKEKLSLKEKIKTGIKPMALYFVVFMALIIFWEIIIRLNVSGGFGMRNMFFVAFVPAQAMALTVIAGLFPNKIINKILFFLEIALICFFYVFQIVYFTNFGSIFSVSMMGMGTDAIGNFWWAITDSIKDSTFAIVMLALPVVASAVLLIIKKNWCAGYNWILHIGCVMLAVALWFGGILGLRVFGNDRQSAYYAFYNSMADTDTTSARLGTLTTTIIESGAYYLGIKGSAGSEQLKAVDMSALTMSAEPEKQEVEVKNISENAVTEEVVEDVAEVVEEPAEPEFIPEPVVFDSIDFNALAENAPNDATKELCEYFAAKDNTYTNEYTGMFKDYNLIYICAEGFSTYAIDPEVTPTLYKMSNNGIILNNYYNSFKNTTTNGEYAFSTSQWPDVSRDASCGTAVGSFAKSVSKFMPFGLGDVFTENGVNSYAFHNYYGHYYRRSYSWPNLGYENMKFMGDGMRFTTTWPSSDLEMFEQSVDDYIEEDQFHAYYMTFSGHGPYTSANCIFRQNINEVKELLGDRVADYNEEAMGYYAGHLEFEKAMKYLLERLEEAGKLDKTLIVIVGDHTPYYLSDSGLDSIAGHDVDMDFEIYQSTCIMYTEGLEEPVETDIYCCNVDIAPTIMNLFGLPYDSRLMMGKDIFSSGLHRVRLYNGSFVTDMVRYNSETGEAKWSDEAMKNYTIEDRENYLKAMQEYTEAEYAASIKLLENNFFLYVWENSGLLDEEQVLAEKKREQSADNRAKSEAAQEAAEAALAKAMENAAAQAIANGEDPAVAQQQALQALADAQNQAAIQQQQQAAAEAAAAAAAAEAAAQQQQQQQQPEQQQ